MIISLLNGLQINKTDMFTMEGAAAVLFYFTIYSFFGWLLENNYNLLTKRQFLKPNFLFGPFKPMYGFAPVFLVYLVSPEADWFDILLLCFFIPTIIEYISGAMLLKFFKRQWWDYSDTPLQLHGHISLPFSIAWAVLSFLCFKCVHPMIVSLYDGIELYWGWIWGAVGLYFLADLALAIRKHSLQQFDRVSDSIKTPSD